MLQTTSPFNRTPSSFHMPKRSTKFAYSSAILKPPVYATSPSMTRIFWWSRKFINNLLVYLWIGLNTSTSKPSARSFCAKSVLVRSSAPKSSYRNLTSTPSSILRFKMACILSQIAPSATIKNSMKTYFFARSKSANKSSNAFSPIS